MTTKATGRVPVTAAAVVAVREANPRTLAGLVAQTGTLGTLAAGGAAWRARATLAPVLVTCVAAPVAVAAPVPAGVALGVLAAGGALTARQPHRDQQPRQAGGETGVRAGEVAEAELDERGRLRPVRRPFQVRARSVAVWSAGLLVWLGAHTSGMTHDLSWWQDLAALSAAAGPGVVLLRRGVPDPADEPGEVVPAPVGPPAHVPPAAWLLGTILTNVCEAERSPIQGGRVVEVLYPATGVAVAVVDLPEGLHTEQVRGELRPVLEALLARAGRPWLGELDAGGVQIEPAGVDQLKITASWSKALDEGPLTWKHPDDAAREYDLAPGQVWLGHDDSRRPMIIETWKRGSDGKASAFHMWIIGRNGGGKSTTIRTLFAPGVVAGLELLIPLDGKGDSLEDLAPYSVGGAVARSSEAWRQGVALAYAVMVSRQQRLGGPNPWNGPTPQDPIVRLIIDEYSTVQTGLLASEIKMLCEIARMGRSLGVAVVFSGQIPLVDALPGGSEVRSQVRVVLGHGVQSLSRSLCKSRSFG